MDVLRKNKNQILKLWQERVCENIPASQNQSKLALYDSLPDFLDNLADQLFPQETHELKVSEAKENLIGKVHGQHRANNKYSIDQMIDEYFILKDIVLEVLTSEAHLDANQTEVINKSFQKALQVSAAQFSKSLLDFQEEFILTLAHDLRSPLMAIRMQAEMMDRWNKYDLKHTAKIINGADKINKMIEQLLDNLRATAEVEEADTVEEFDLKDFLAGVVENYSDTLPNDVVLLGNSVKVCWDKEAFERVFDNLVSNASKYGDQSRPITIEIKHDDTNVFLSVHNFGEPIPPEDLIHLFEKFRRSQATQKTRGWGIGLNYVKSVVEKHKGIVLINSDEKGTVFKFELPQNAFQTGKDGLREAKQSEPNMHSSPL